MIPPPTLQTRTEEAFKVDWHSCKIVVKPVSVKPVPKMDGSNGHSKVVWRILSGDEKQKTKAVPGRLDVKQGS